MFEFLSKKTANIVRVDEKENVEISPDFPSVQKANHALGAHIEKREDGYYVELNDIGKFFPIGHRTTWEDAFDMATAFAFYLENFTDPAKSLEEWRRVFGILSDLVAEVRADYPYEGIEGFSDGDFTYCADLERLTIFVRFRGLDVYVTKEGKFNVEIVTSYSPKKTVVVCTGVSKSTVVDMLENNPAAKYYPERRPVQLFFSRANMDFFDSKRETDK